MNRAATEKKIADVAQFIVREFAPDRIILFGSWAWGQPTDDSDVDFLVIKQADNSRKLAARIDGTLFPRPFPLDVIVYDLDQVKRRQAMGDPFITEILTKGKVLYAA